TVEQAEPEVAVEQAAPEAEVEQPDVAAGEEEAAPGEGTATLQEDTAEPADSGGLALTEAGPEAEQQATRPEGGISAENAVGREVATAGGEDLGEIEELIFAESGEVEAAIVEVGGFLGIGAREIAIPWDR